ncbi:hypothetical protein N9N67_02380 [Bacteriovoracaceae bacterium]|nr:hypothetical protein [Bacteriovoracaceae bacterium]
MKGIYLLFVLLISPINLMGQDAGLMFDAYDSDINVGGDIFSDFNEDLDASTVLEDERFYRYARFYSVNLGIGKTSFTGNRGLAYEDDDPSYVISLNYFLNFQTSFIMGIEYSKHTMFIDTYVNGSRGEIVGAVETAFIRPFMGFRYYIDTTNLNTPITYSNPYFTARIEYWYQTNTFPENDNLDDENGGGLGSGVGGGLEFPIELKSRYINVEFLYHWVNYFDRNTMDYRKIPSGEEDVVPRDGEEVRLDSKYGYENLRGNSWSIMISYNVTW